MLTTFEVAIKRSRRRQYLKLFLSLFCVFIACLILTYKGMTSRVYKNAAEIEERYLLAMRIAYPNIYSYNGKFKPLSLLSGIYHDQQYKDLAGIRIPYHTYEASYDIHRTFDDRIYPEYVNGGIYSSDGQHKLPQFYNAHITEISFPPLFTTESNELRHLDHMPNQLVELAVTFDKDYTYEAIQQMIPNSLEINWYWIGTESDYPLSPKPLDNIFGTNEYGLSQGRFLPSLEQAVSSKKYHWIREETSKKGKFVDIFNSYTDIKAYLKKAGHLDTRQEKDRAKLSFAGVILTGKSEDFKELKDKDWVYATSIGSSVPNQPYYQLDKD